MEIIKKALSIIVLAFFASLPVFLLSMFLIKPLFGTTGLIAIIVLLFLIIVYQWSKEEDQP
jgi:ABC-type protease/lipase transport system fused ATPase/permease subunit